MKDSYDTSDQYISSIFDNDDFTINSFNQLFIKKSLITSIERDKSPVEMDEYIYIIIYLYNE